MTDQQKERQPDETFEQWVERLGGSVAPAGLGSTVVFTSKQAADAAKKQAGK